MCRYYQLAKVILFLGIQAFLIPSNAIKCVDHLTLVAGLEPAWVMVQRKVVGTIFPFDIGIIDTNETSLILGGQKLTVESAKNIAASGGTYSYVVSENKEGKLEIWVGEKHRNLQLEKIYAAGEIVLELDETNKVVKYVRINNKSGLHLPPINTLNQAVAALWANDIYPENLEIYDVRDKPLLVFHREAYERFSILLLVDHFPKDF